MTLRMDNEHKEIGAMELDVGIAGWILSGEILREKTLTLLEYPAVCASYGVKTVELCSRFFESQDAAYLNDLRKRLEDNGLSVRNIAVDMGNIAGADAAVRRTDIEALKQWFYTAAAVGSEAIRINTGHADDAGAMVRVIEGYRELVAVGEQAGVRLLIENHGAPMVTAVLVVRTGTDDETADLSGAAHFLEHLLFNGTERRTQKQLYDEADLLGVYNNAATRRFYTVYFVLAGKDRIAEAMDIQEDMVFHSVFPPEKFEKEKGIVLEEIGKDEQDPDYLADRLIRSVLFEGTPYARPVLGTRRSVRAMSREDVVAYWRACTVPGNATLLVAGDFKTGPMIETVREIIRAAARKGHPRRGRRQRIGVRIGDTDLQIHPVRSRGPRETAIRHNPHLAGQLRRAGRVDRRRGEASGHPVVVGTMTRFLVHAAAEKTGKTIAPARRSQR